MNKLLALARMGEGRGDAPPILVGAAEVDIPDMASPAARIRQLPGINRSGRSSRQAAHGKEICMTDNPLVEAVALAISNSTKQLTIEELAKHTCTKAANGASGLSVIEATAALRAIEDAGWKVVKKEIEGDTVAPPS